MANKYYLLNELKGTIVNKKELERLCKARKIKSAKYLKEKDTYLLPFNFLSSYLKNMKSTLSKKKEHELKVNAFKIRLEALNCVYNAKSGHIGGSLSIAEILSYLYFKELNIDVNDDKKVIRDRLVLSKGHCTPALYSALALKGFFPLEELKNFRKANHFLQGHPDMKGTSGVDMTTGSLGLGFSAACGMAISSKLENKKYNVYAILGDGEIQEGQIWEAAMFAGNKKLDNLCAFVDYNSLQISGKVDDVMKISPLDEKFSSFGWNVVTIDGHNLNEIHKAVRLFKKSKLPMLVILKTIKGKGVSFMENDASWHGTPPKKEQYELAYRELEDSLNKLVGGN